MDEPLNAANATIAVDCPWCAEPIRTTVAELTDGLTCDACLVEVGLAPDPVAALTPIAA